MPDRSMDRTLQLRKRAAERSRRRRRTKPGDNVHTCERCGDRYVGTKPDICGKCEPKAAA